MCLQVAEAAADNSSQVTEASGQHEAALYATLAGHLHKVLPVCQTRADVLWAYTRCWLEAQVDRQLAAGQDQDDSDLHAALSVGTDAVAATRRDRPEEVHKVVLDDVTGFWPPSRYWFCHAKCSTMQKGHAKLEESVLHGRMPDTHALLACSDVLHHVGQGAHDVSTNAYQTYQQFMFACSRQSSFNKRPSQSCWQSLQCLET